MAEPQASSPPGPPRTVSAQDARQGITPGVVRLMLGAAMAMVVIGLVVAFLLA